MDKKARRKEYRRKYNKENKEKISEYGKKYRKEHKEERQNYKKKYREENKEQIKEQAKKYREANIEKLSAKINCPCGGSFRYDGRHKHYKTHKHREYEFFAKQ